MSSENPWAGKFGRSYVDRNNMSSSELDMLYQNNFGISRTDLNAEFLSDISKESTILEVGCNRGLQLELLGNQGYDHLYGLDISWYALELISERVSQSNAVSASALVFPFRNESFDLVFTSGVLIHIHPKEIGLALDEIYRCTRRYIWCFEYLAEEETEVRYRGKGGLLWKNNFLQVFTQRFRDLSIIRTRKLKYFHNENTDMMFLLEKRNTHCNS